MSEELTQDELDMLDYMQECTELDPEDVAPVSTCPDDGWNVEYTGDSDGHSK